MRAPRLLLAIALTVAANHAGALPAASRPGAERVKDDFGVALMPDSDDGVLHGGETARIEWSGGSHLPPGADEWEAFLSLDGGAHYSIRLTPHLALSLRRVQIVVPDISSSRVRVMIRVGDETTEQRVELPRQFSIEPSSRSPVRSMLSAVRVGFAGEAAREGDRGVTVWAEGGRFGEAPRMVADRGPGALLDSSIGAFAGHGTITVTLSSRSRIPLPKWIATARAAAEPESAGTHVVILPTWSALLLSTRRNI